MDGGGKKKLTDWHIKTQIMHRKNTNRRRYSKTDTERRRYALKDTAIHIDRYKQKQIFIYGRRDG
jgi:hypothetical protein